MRTCIGWIMGLLVFGAAAGFGQERPQLGPPLPPNPPEAAQPGPIVVKPTPLPTDEPPLLDPQPSPPTVLPKAPQTRPEERADDLSSPNLKHVPEPKPAAAPRKLEARAPLTSPLLIAPGVKIASGQTAGGMLTPLWSAPGQKLLRPNVP